MGKPWEADKQKYDTYEEQAKAFYATVAIRAGNEQEDQQENTDLISMPFRCGIRLRAAKHFKAYPHDFTIRCSRPSGRQTELQKILNGWGNHYLYGFVSPCGCRLSHMWIGDLDIFRDWYEFYYEHKVKPWKMMSTRSGDAKFLIIDRRKLPSDFIMAEQGVW